MEEYGLTQQQVSEILGKSRSSIANTVRILNLDPRVIELVQQNKLTEEKEPKKKHKQHR